jgi:hypothetical protein
MAAPFFNPTPRWYNFLIILVNTTTMTTQEIANRLVELNRADDYQTAYQELYDTEKIVSIENWGEREEYVGMEAITKKGEEWFSMVEEVHSTSVGGPVVADHSFAVTFSMDVTWKPGAMPGFEGRQSFTELAIYRVNEAGKIYHEEFFA